MWLTAVFHQVSLFSLKPPDATSTGGRSLLVPTPFSIKMALLDVALRLYGQKTGAALFPIIRDLAVALSPPPQFVVNNCFVRIHKPRRGKSSASEPAGDETGQEDGGSDGPFIRSVAFREYVQYHGPLGVALSISDKQQAEQLAALIVQVTYFGKRGSLFQIDSPPRFVEALPPRHGYVQISSQSASVSRDVHAVLQVLDDCGPKLTFEQVDIYNDKRMAPGKDRIHTHVMLPYRLMRSGRGFSLYERSTP
jgi:hypothetical protein